MEYCIEVATHKNATPKEVGDLLEQLAMTILQTQGFEVTSQIRLVASEIDLLCRHKISRERVYVECKAYRDTVVSGAQLRQLLGTVQFENFSAGWLFSTGALSKDAKGFVETWKERPESERRMLRIYEPKQFIQFLIEASIVIDTIKIPFSNTSFGQDIKKWVLLITSFGNYWVAIVEKTGTSKYATCFNGYDGTPISDAVLSLIKETNTSINTFEFRLASNIFSAYEAYTTSQRVVSFKDLYIDSSVDTLITKIKQLPGVRIFDIQPVERFGRDGFAITIEIEKIGLYSAIGSDIKGAINSIVITMPIPKNVLDVLSEIAQASAPRNLMAGVLTAYEPKKTYLAWSEVSGGNLEDIIPIKLGAELDETQAIKSTIIIAAELLSLRIISEETNFYEYTIWVEDESGNQWSGDINLESSNPVVTEVRYFGKNENLD